MRANCDFPGIERTFHQYIEDCRYLESLEDRKATLPAFRSSSDFSERVDTGGSYSDPVSIWFEKLEFLEEEIARVQLRVIPVAKLLDYLGECEPEAFKFFQCRYVKKMSWEILEAEMGLSQKVRRRIRDRLIVKGARFIRMEG
ncbi:MAG: hypothetical protein EOM03_11220 [Clostridia bacterium]|nr:hypothetical protein [Clostridia bacterium]